MHTNCANSKPSRKEKPSLSSANALASRESERESGELGVSSVDKGLSSKDKFTNGGSSSSSFSSSPALETIESQAESDSSPKNKGGKGFENNANTSKSENKGDGPGAVEMAVV
jgi:hypothetical protein